METIRFSCPILASSTHPTTKLVTDTSTTQNPTTTHKYQRKINDVRLPRTITPIQYDLELQPNLYGSDPEIFNFEGFVRIKLQCVEKARNITLNSNKLLIDVDSIVVVPDDGNVPNPKYTDLTTDAARQFAVISLDNELIPGKTYTLEMKFSGPLKTDLKGLYLSSYQEAGTTRYLATTQFQPTDARKAFPCFDEPDMKAVFNITLIRKQDWTSISNMELISSKDRGNDMVADSYSLTPRMSTYLVAFVVSQFTYRTNITSSNIRERAWARPESFSETEIALDAGVKILPFYEDLFGIKFPLKKQANWLLNNITNNQQSLFKWFGNLVTMKWWDDLWLNEGFATYMEYVGTNHFDEFTIGELFDAFEFDGLKSSHPVYVPVNNPDEIGEIFDKISYAKRSVKDGKQLPFTVKEIMDTWINQINYPVVMVTRTPSGLHLSQRRFLINKDSTDEEKAGETDMENAFEAVEYLNAEMNRVPWVTAARELSYLDDMLAKTAYYDDFKVCVDPNIKGKGGQDEWDFAYSQYKQTQVASEKGILLTALGCTGEIGLLNHYLQLTLDANEIRTQDIVAVITSVGSNLKQFVEDHPDLGTGERAFKQAIENTETNIKWMNNNLDLIKSWLQKLIQMTSLNNVRLPRSVLPQHYDLELKPDIYGNDSESFKFYGLYYLSFDFSGPLKEDLHGFYLNFEPNDARKAFPCFDEPDIKASYNITILRKPNKISLSNMPKRMEQNRSDGYIADVYEETKKLSTYLVAFIVCDFDRWFGNLVTMKWWDDLWLNEGFATYMEYVGTNHFDEFTIGELFDAFEFDGLKSSHPVYVPVNNPDEIGEIFDKISYAKRSVKDGKQLPFTVKEIVDTWINQINYPVVMVTRTPSGLHLSQRRFLINKDSTDEEKAGETDMENAFEAVEYLNAEMNRVPWVTAARELSYLDDMLAKTAYYDDFKLKQFVEDHPDLGTGERAFKQAIENTETNIKWMNNNLDLIKSWLQKSGSVYYLSFDFSGPLKEDLHGFYLSTYTRGGETRYMATSDFEPNDARKAFPCFDEPDIKASYNITILRKPNKISLSNMPKRMEQNSIWARSDYINQTALALNASSNILTFFEDYFEIPYPLPKQDLIAIPDFSAGAMENWGLITYDETYLLFEEGVSSAIDAEKWFGDLVTMEWWDDLWLNEGFANFMEYFGTDYLYPDWKMFEIFTANELHRAFAADGLLTSHPIYVPVNGPEEIEIQLPLKEPKDWVIANVQQFGFYRVNYDAKNWKNLINQLKEDHKNTTKY
ncbi:LOW QUALITY PROTEIN: hypothetical protein KUTeg_010698 [Tegillarca granosa]|uniref:Aminopeptidase n=1 Tax=Tegillarca granosa TaxID=220873 RepID=A0ABQ9F1S0_TEGGR|nr:LOW QUALITY PROTEIN: hypothetical protein KUTeg_010698 [Tegillarca granosa]